MASPAPRAGASSRRRDPLPLVDGDGEEGLVVEHGGDQLGSLRLGQAGGVDDDGGVVGGLPHPQPVAPTFGHGPILPGPAGARAFVIASVAP